MKESENKGWVNSLQTCCLPVSFDIIQILSDVKNIALWLITKALPVDY